MTSLSRLINPNHSLGTVQRSVLLRAMQVRDIYDYSKLPVPPPAKIQMKVPPNEVGFFKYERYWSQDPKLKPQIDGDTWARAIFSGIQFEWELWIVYGCWVFCTILVAWIAIITCTRIEVYIDRTRKYPPWDWSRARDNYWKLGTVFWDPEGHTHQRLFVMEKIQDELYEAARQRGTRE